MRSEPPCFRGVRPAVPRRWGLLLGTALCALIWAPLAGAQETSDAQRFDPTPSQQHSFVGQPSARVLDGGQWEVGVLGDYANDPVRPSETDAAASVADVYTLNFLAAVGIAGWFELGLGVPGIVHQREEDLAGTTDGATLQTGTAAFGDLRVVPRFQLFSTEQPSDPQGVTMGIVADTYLPTGDETVLQGDDLRTRPRLAFDWASEGGTRVGTNLGYLVEIPTDSDEETGEGNSVTWGVGASLPLATRLELVPELSGSVPTDGSVGEDAVPLDGLLGAKIHASDGLLVQLGGGAGLDDGFGSPDWRGFLGVSYSATPTSDTDRDGVMDDDDACPEDAEDRDGFEDRDGCAEADNDNDGLADADDVCPDAAEDVDGWFDNDGCAELDNDGDLMADLEDRCPLDEEDLDGFSDEDGCPDGDNDSDGIMDEADACPLQAENQNDNNDLDGCPDEEPVPVEAPQVAMVTPCEMINISDTIQFEVDEAVIEPDSYWLLDQVAEVLRANPDIQEVRIEGHADSQGSEEHNLDLTNRRADAVRRYLVENAGIEFERLSAQGYGESQPVASNDSADGRAQNRRVDFTIQQQEGCPQ